MSSDSCATAMPSKSTGDRGELALISIRERASAVWLSTPGICRNVSGELRDIFQMARFSRGRTFLTRLNSEGDGLIISQNVKGTSLEKIMEVVGGWEVEEGVHPH